MNRSIWTWIQLAASITNAAFLVIAHVPSTGTAAEIASVLVGEAERRIAQRRRKRPVRRLMCVPRQARL